MARKNREAIPIQPTIPVKPLEPGNFYNVPTSPTTNLISQVLIAGAEVEALEDKKNQVSHAQNIEVLADKPGIGRQVVLTEDRAALTVEIPDISKLTGSNKAAKKLFVLALIKANEQAIHGGKLTRDKISFPLQELVDMGFYKSLRSARKGFETGADILTSLKIKGRIQQAKNKESTIDMLEVLFTGYTITNSQCFLRLNYAIDWSFIVQYFTILPRYYFSLPNRPSDLLYYIFYLARQRTRDIEEQGYFTIGFRAIQQRLQLPEENSTKNPQRDIKEPIDEAITQIEDGHRKYYNNMELTMIPVYNEAASISEYLEKGHLKVCLSGSFAKSFIAISKETAKQIDTAQKRQARITEKAVAINTAKKMDTEKQ